MLKVLSWFLMFICPGLINCRTTSSNVWNDATSFHPNPYPATKQVYVFSMSQRRQKKSKKWKNRERERESWNDATCSHPNPYPATQRQVELSPQHNIKDITTSSDDYIWGLN